MAVTYNPKGPNAMLTKLLRQQPPAQPEPQYQVGYVRRPDPKTELARATSGKRVPIQTTRVPRLLREHFPQVKTVSDSLARVEVTVTPRDQRGSYPKAPDSCAMARACTRELALDGAIIGLGASYLIQGSHATRFDTPDLLAREITAFDRHGEFAAGTYHLSPVCPASRFGARRSPHAATGKSPRRVQPIKTSGVRTLREPPRGTA